MACVSYFYIFNSLSLDVESDLIGFCKCALCTSRGSSYIYILYTVWPILQMDVSYREKESLNTQDFNFKKRLIHGLFLDSRIHAP